MKQQTCKYRLEDGSICASPFHSKMWHNPPKPIKRSPIKKQTLVEYLNDPKNIKSAVEKSMSDQRKLVKKVRKKKTPSKTLLKKKLEKLVKDYVKRRDDYTCQYCGLIVEGTNCHASHVIPVSRSGYLQFDPLNMKVLCHYHHLHWWHKHPVEAGKWFTDTFPERWQYLSGLHIQRLKPMTELELQEKIDYYKSLL